MRTRLVLASATFVLTGVLFAPTFSVGATVPPTPPVDTVAPVVITPSDSVPDEQGVITGVVETTLPINSSAATTIPAGCAIPMAPQMVFVGELLSIADTTATFRVIQVRAGTASGYITNDTVEVRYHFLRCLSPRFVKMHRCLVAMQWWVSAVQPAYAQILKILCALCFKTGQALTLVYLVRFSKTSY